MTKKEGRLLAFLCLFLGMVLGFMMAPMKAGVTCGNNNTIYGDKIHKVLKRGRRGNPEALEDEEETDCGF